MKPKVGGNAASESAAKNAAVWLGPVLLALLGRIINNF